ncbi:protein chibby homolog 1 isoform X1 [Hydra vulgaris]|uniref:protein chibby homolog 1 isoform X1 n=1 Tax=Hydra vulgaris TaxID=6087 RepID=UPI0001927671|nr:protein chibby homolog 1 isoform X1 [Hydra vulgaris]
MPLFGKPSFKASRKVPKRRADAGSSNTIQLADKDTLDPNLDFSQIPLQLSLGGRKMMFQNGSWISRDAGSESSLQESDEATALKEKILILEEERNLLKYKIELLLDMLAVSQSDLTYMEQEICQLKKTKN